MHKKKRPFEVRRRAFAIWQQLGYLPWKKQKEEKKPREGKTSRDFYKGAFDSSPSRRSGRTSYIRIFSVVFE